MGRYVFIIMNCTSIGRIGVLLEQQLFFNGELDGYCTAAFLKRLYFPLGTSNI